MLRKLAAACGDGHTFPFASLPQKDSPRWSQFSTVLIGDRLFINSVESDELEALGLKRGIEITAINGETPKEYASRELIPYVSSSTPQWAEHKVFDDYGFSEGRNGSEFTLTLSPDSGKTTSDITLKRDASSIKPRNPRSSKVSLQMTPDSIVIVTIPNFASSRITEDFDKIYPQILNSRGLIIDLRNNEGGNSGFGDYILKHLTSDSIPSNPWTTPIYKPAFASWGNAPETYESPTRKMAPLANITPYLGPVIIVTNRGTFSAAEDFCAVFRNMNRGQIIGTPTAGSTGNGVRVKLTKNISANICSKHDRMADGTEFVGIGIIPDIIIEDSPESYFSDKDIVLEKAISIISN